jgi:hypothetical protein
VTTAAVVAVGVIVVLVLLVLLARRNPGAADHVPAVVARRRSSGTPPRDPALRAWEADVLAGSTGGPRGRARLGRKLEPIVTAHLRDRYGIAPDHPEAAARLGPEWVFLNGGPPPRDRPKLGVEDAVATLLDRLDQPLSRGGA